MPTSVKTVLCNKGEGHTRRRLVSHSYREPESSLGRDPFTSISAAASRLRISAVVASALRPALPSKTQGPALFLGVMGPSTPGVSPGGDGVRLSRKAMCRPAPDAEFLIGRGSETACGKLPRCGLSGVILTVTSMASTSWTSESSGSGVAGSGGVAIGTAGAVSVPGVASTRASASASASPSLFNCSHSSASSSTSASRSAPARQLGQMKMGYWGDMSSDLTHLKCQVCEQGATNKDWQG